MTFDVRDLFVFGGLALTAGSLAYFAHWSLGLAALGTGFYLIGLISRWQG